MALKDFVQQTKLKMAEQREINGLLNDFYDIMLECKVYTESKFTFKVSDVTKYDWGYECKIYTAKGLSFVKLENCRAEIEDGINCRLILTIPEGEQNRDIRMPKFVIAKFITHDIIGDLPYQVIKVKPWELYIGNTCDIKPVKIDCTAFPFILLTGATRSGKSKLLDCAMTTIVANCNPREVELWLMQVAKSDLVIYEDCEITRGFADTLEKSNKMLDYLIDEMDRRDKLIRPLRKKGRASNFKDYNAYYPTQQLSFIHLVVDEMASIFDLQGCDNETKKLKQQIASKLDKVAQYGAGLGINGIFCLQRATHEKLSPFIKSQSNTRISFKQNNSKSSEVAMDDPMIALGLKQREAVYYTNQYDFIKTPVIADRLVYETILPKLKPKHRMLDLFPAKKDNNNDKGDNSSSGESKKDKSKKKQDDANKQVEQLKTMLETMMATSKSTAERAITMPDTTPVYDKVTPVPIEKDIRKLMEENIKKIGDGYVPYVPPNPNRIVHDQTRISPSQTQKPIKTKKEV